MKKLGFWELFTWRKETYGTKSLWLLIYLFFSFIFLKVLSQQTFLVFQEQGVFSITGFRLPKRLEDVLKKTSCKYIKDILRTSWRRLVRQKNVTLKTSSRHLQEVFSASSPRWMFQRGFHVVSTWNTHSVFKGMFPVTLNKCSGTFAFLTYIILELSTHECFLKKVAYLLIYSIVSECL